MIAALPLAARAQEVASDVQLSTTDILLWDVLPYVTMAVFVVGMIWRYRYDRFGWTTRSAAVREETDPHRKPAVPLRHPCRAHGSRGRPVDPGAMDAGRFGIRSRRITFAVLLGAFAGAATLIGIVLLIIRRRTVGPVSSATTKKR